MIVKGKDVIGLNIVTVDTGKIVENVDDIAYNPETQRVEALLVSSGGLFSSAKAVHMDDVHNIGEDAVIVSSETVIKSVKDLTESVHSIADSNKHLVKTNVLTTEGKELGKVTDIFFDSATGMVESMEVSQGGFKTLTDGKKIIKPSDIVTIGADATIVSAYTEEALEEQGERGGLKGVINNAKDKVEEVSDTVRESAENTGETLKEKSSVITENIKSKTSDTAEFVQEQSSTLRRSVNQNVDDMKEGLHNVKEKSATKVSTIRDKGDKVVAETQEAIEDGEKKITIRKKRITKK